MPLITLIRRNHSTSIRSALTQRARWLFCLSLVSISILNPQYAHADLTECRELFAIEDNSLTTAPEIGTVDLEGTNQEETLTRESRNDFIPFNVELRGLRLSDWQLPSSPQDKNYRSALSELLDMMTETHFENADRKLTLEKGELHLARPIGAGQSIEFEYQKDERSKSFRLSKVSLFKPNGQEVTLDKSPVADNGQRFERDRHILLQTNEVYSGGTRLASLRPLELSDLSEWAADRKDLIDTIKQAKRTNSSTLLQLLSASLDSNDQSRLQALQSNTETLKVPLSISGPLLKEVEKWAKLLPHVARGRVRAEIRGDHITRLIWIARAGAIAKVVVNTTRKQFAKWIVLGAIFIGLEHAPHSWDAMRHVMPGHGLSHLISNDQRPLQPAQEAVVTELISRLQARSATDPSLARGLMALENANTNANESHAPSRTSLRDSTPQELSGNSEIKNLSETIAQLSDAETTAGGEITFYMSDLATHHSKRISAAEVKVPLSGAKSGYLIALFSKSQKMILAPIVQSPDQTLPQIATILLERTGHEQVYDLIANSLVVPNGSAVTP